jgi:carboxymethylenebutenolidase
MPIKVKQVTLTPDDGGEMHAYVSHQSKAGPHPGILVLQEALGVNSQIRGVADRYAELGFVAVAPDLFHRIKPGYEADTIVTEEVMPLVQALTTEGLISDVTAAFEWITSEGKVSAVQTAAVGYCMGGRAAYLANSALPLGAAISYYGGRIAPTLLDRASTLHASQLFFWGGKDLGIPPEQHRAVIDALRVAKKEFVDVEFSECGHAFFNEQTDRYNAAAAHQSWAIGIAFLEEELGYLITAQYARREF